MKRIIATLGLVAVTATAVAVSAPRNAQAADAGGITAIGATAGFLADTVLDNTVGLLLNPPPRTLVVHERVIEPSSVVVVKSPPPAVTCKTKRHLYPSGRMVTRTKCSDGSSFKQVSWR